MWCGDECEVGGDRMHMSVCEVTCCLRVFESVMVLINVLCAKHGSTCWQRPSTVVKHVKSPLSRAILAHALGSRVHSIGA